MICPNCAAWVYPLPDKEAQTVRCRHCQHTWARRFLPLFLLTGPSGVGKTTVVPYLWELLPDCEVFETDILWDSAGDWGMVKCNWLRIADSLAQRGRPTVLCGTFVPEDIARCEIAPYFSAIYWASLDCAPDKLEARLRERPDWRGLDEEKIAEHLRFAEWFRRHGDTLFQPPLHRVDTTFSTPETTASEIAAWVRRFWSPQ